jgi:hypothetical protein
MAAFARQILVLLIPLVGVLYPLLRFGPAAYAWLMQRRIYREYVELKAIESRLEASQGDVAALALRLGRLEERANRAWVPAAYAHMLYTLRIHIGLVKARFESVQRSRSGQG